MGSLDFIEQRDFMIDIGSLGSKQAPKVGLDFSTHRKSIYGPPEVGRLPGEGEKS